MKKNYLASAIMLMTVSGSLLAQTVVTVNGEKIDSSEIERRAKIVQTNSQGQVSDGPELRNYLTEQLIIQALVTQEAKKLKLNQSKEYKTAEENAQKEIKAKGLDKEKDYRQNWADLQSSLLMDVYAEHVLKQSPVTAADVKKEYDDFKKLYDNTDEVQFGQIFTNKADQAEAAIKDLNAKKKFTDIAPKYSLDPVVKNTKGISSEYVSLMDLKQSNPTIYEAVANLDKGQYTKTPIKDGDMNLILYINNKRKLSLPTFEEAKPNIESTLRDKKLSETLDKLGKSAKIEFAK